MNIFICCIFHLYQSKNWGGNYTIAILLWFSILFIIFSNEIYIIFNFFNLYIYPLYFYFCVYLIFHSHRFSFISVLFLIKTLSLTRPSIFRSRWSSCTNPLCEWIWNLDCFYIWLTPFRRSLQSTCLFMLMPLLGDEVYGVRPT